MGPSGEYREVSITFHLLHSIGSDSPAIRCIASVNILGAALNTTSENHKFHLPDYETGIRLPSSKVHWLKDKQSWEGPPDVLYASDVVGSVFAGVRPDIQADDYAFLTLVSAALSHICSVELLTRTKHPDLYSTFVKKMSAPLDMLDSMWNEQLSGSTASGSLPTPLIQCTRSLLDSAFYHLHGSEQLASMARLLKSPELLDNADELKRIQEVAELDSLEKALFRAAASLRIDSRLGLRYVQKVAPHRFAPLSSTAVAEGGRSLQPPCLFGRRWVIPFFVSRSDLLFQVYFSIGIFVSNGPISLRPLWMLFLKK